MGMPGRDHRPSIAGSINSQFASDNDGTASVRSAVGTSLVGVLERAERVLENHKGYFAVTCAAIFGVSYYFQSLLGAPSDAEAVISALVNAGLGGIAGSAMHEIPAMLGGIAKWLQGDNESLGVLGHSLFWGLSATMSLAVSLSSTPVAQTTISACEDMPGSNVWGSALGALAGFVRALLTIKAIPTIPKKFQDLVESVKDPYRQAKEDFKDSRYQEMIGSSLRVLLNSSAMAAAFLWAGAYTLSMHDVVNKAIGHVASGFTRWSIGGQWALEAAALAPLFCFDFYWVQQGLNSIVELTDPKFRENLTGRQFLGALIARACVVTVAAWSGAPATANAKAGSDGARAATRLALEDTYAHYINVFINAPAGAAMNCGSLTNNLSSLGSFTKGVCENLSECAARHGHEGLAQLFTAMAEGLTVPESNSIDEVDENRALLQGAGSPVVGKCGGYGSIEDGIAAAQPESPESEHRYQQMPLVVDEKQLSREHAAPSALFVRENTDEKPLSPERKSSADKSFSSEREPAADTSFPRRRESSSNFCSIFYSIFCCSRRGQRSGSDISSDSCSYSQ